ncbi:MAG: hypothetical protein FWG47_05165, partial [Propionibacteriaceae bacterium]|nr:hypothetical protein [Propionibacteriaceae bacterium]
DVPPLLPDTELSIALKRQCGLYCHPGWFYDLPEVGVLVISLLPSEDDFAVNMQKLRAGLKAILDG